MRKTRNAIERNINESSFRRSHFMEGKEDQIGEIENKDDIADE